MKTIFSLIVWLCLTTGAAFSQKPITVTEDSIVFGTGKFPGFLVNIPEVQFQNVQKQWIKALQKSTKSTVTIDKDELTIFGTNIKEISEMPINVYSKLISKDSVIQLATIIELKKDQYLEKKTGEVELLKGKNYLSAFAKDLYIDLAKDQLAEEEKKLKELENQLESLKNDKSGLQKDIQSCKTDIITEKDNIALKNNELTSLSAEILTQNEQLNSMQEGETKTNKKEYISDLEKQKKKLLNAIESSENNINKANNKIDQCNQDIPRNETQQTELAPKIAQQEAVVRKYTDKLTAIKSY